VIRARPAPFRGRHFADVVIMLCVRWYLRYSLSFRDLEEITAERGLAVDHVTNRALGPALWKAPG
jgi:transposase-like protein